MNTLDVAPFQATVIVVNVPVAAWSSPPAIVNPPDLSAPVAVVVPNTNASADSSYIPYAPAEAPKNFTSNHVLSTPTVMAPLN